MSVQFAADVVACNRNPNTDEVEPLDAWNSAIKRRTTVDPNNDVIEFSTSYTDGRISCRWDDYNLVRLLKKVHVELCIL